MLTWPEIASITSAVATLIILYLIIEELFLSQPITSTCFVIPDNETYGVCYEATENKEEDIQSIKIPQGIDRAEIFLAIKFSGQYVKWDQGFLSVPYVKINRTFRNVRVFIEQTGENMFDLVEWDDGEYEDLPWAKEFSVDWHKNVKTEPIPYCTKDFHLIFPLVIEGLEEGTQYTLQTKTLAENAADIDVSDELQIRVDRS